MDTSKYKYWVSYSVNTVTFPLYNLSGKMVGYQQYRPLADKTQSNNPKLSRYFTRLERGVDGFWGLETIQMGKPIFIVEGIFKAAKLHSLGYSAITACGSNPKRLKNWIFIMGQVYEIYAIGDNDSAGQLLVDLIARGKCSPKDIDEMGDQEIFNFINEICLVNGK